MTLSIQKTSITRNYFKDFLYSIIDNNFEISLNQGQEQGSQDEDGRPGLEADA